MDTQTFLGGCVAGGVAAWFLSRNGGKGPADGSDGGVVKVEVAYWAIRGLAAPLRMMCVYAGDKCDAKFTMFPVTEKEGGGWNLSSWFGSRKGEILSKNALANLPFVVDETNGQTVTQSNACMTFLARKLGLMGANATDVSENEQLICEVFDLRNAAVGTFYNPKGDLAGQVEKATGSYAKFEAWLQMKEKKFLVAGTPVAADFHLFEMIDQHEMLAKDLSIASPLATFPKLSQYYKDFRVLPQLQSYFSGEYHKLPCNNRMAIWGQHGLYKGEKL